MQYQSKLKKERKSIMKKIQIVSIMLLLAVFVLSVPATQVSAATSASSQAAVIPTFVIKAVDRDNLVTIQTDNLRLNDSYVVTMGLIGTRGVNGYQVGTIKTTDSGRVTKTFTIPAALVGTKQISIRLQSPTTGFFAFNWFYNADANLDLIGTPDTGTTSASYAGYPYFYIKSVVKDSSVTIAPYNFPPNQTFKVRMNWMGTRGVAGAIVGTVTTDANGKLSHKTFDIPDFLMGSYQIAIRLESPSSGYFAYNWFYNNNAP
jgi:hypothetical protein